MPNFERGFFVAALVLNQRFWFDVVFFTNISETYLGLCQATMMDQLFLCRIWAAWQMHRGGSRTAATFKMELFVIIVNGLTVNYYHKVLHLGCCSSPRSASSECIQINVWMNLNEVIVNIPNSFIKHMKHFIKVNHLVYMGSRSKFCWLSPKVIFIESWNWYK